MERENGGCEERWRMKGKGWRLKNRDEMGNWRVKAELEWKDKNGKWREKTWCILESRWEIKPCLAGNWL